MRESCFSPALSTRFTEFPLALANPYFPASGRNRLFQDKVTSMAGCTSAELHPAPDLEAKSLKLEQHDPRWDDDGFNQWADDCGLQWLSVEYVRQLHDTAQLLPGCQDCQSSCVHVGAPPNGVELFNVIHRYLGYRHPDPCGDHLKGLGRTSLGCG